MFMQLIFLKFKPGSNSKKTDKHAADCSKLVVAPMPSLIFPYHLKLELSRDEKINYDRISSVSLHMKQPWSLVTN